MKKKILFVQNLLLLSAALSLAIFTTSCDREEDNPVTVTPSVDGTGGGTGTGNDGGGTGGEIVEETLTFTANGVSFNMVPVEGGTFWMGAQSTNQGGQNYDANAEYGEDPVHQVTLSDYYMGETEVTQALWQAVMGNNPSCFFGAGHENYPVEYVSWDDVVNNFLPALNAATGRTFALPTEAQWEFAARGGNSSHDYKYAGSNSIGDVAWYYDNAWNVDYSHPDYGTHVVGTKSPNELGLYDMTGNVGEWCADRYGDYHTFAVSDPTGPVSGDYRVLRGGSWGSYAGYCRVSYRDYDDPVDRNGSLGFRLVLLP